MKIDDKYPVIDRWSCSLCLGCVEIAPQVFFFRKDFGFIEVIDREIYPLEEVDDAIMLCPRNCISWN